MLTSILLLIGGVSAQQWGTGGGQQQGRWGPQNAYENGPCTDWRGRQGTYVCQTGQQQNQWNGGFQQQGQIPCTPGGGNNQWQQGSNQQGGNQWNQWGQSGYLVCQVGGQGGWGGQQQCRPGTDKLVILRAAAEWLRSWSGAQNAARWLRAAGYQQSWQWITPQTMDQWWYQIILWRWDQNSYNRFIQQLRQAGYGQQLRNQYRAVVDAISRIFRIRENVSARSFRSTIQSIIRAIDRSRYRVGNDNIGRAIQYIRSLVRTNQYNQGFVRQVWNYLTQLQVCRPAGNFNRGGDND